MVHMLGYASLLLIKEFISTERPNLNRNQRAIAQRKEVKFLRRTPFARSQTETIKGEQSIEIDGSLSSSWENRGKSRPSGSRASR